MPFCGRTARGILTYRGSFRGLNSHGTSTLGRRLCKSSLVIHRFTLGPTANRVRSAFASRLGAGRRHRAFLFYRILALGSLRVVFRLRAENGPLRSRRPVSARSLRCGLVFRRFSSKGPSFHFAFPTSVAAPRRTRASGLGRLARSGLPIAAFRRVASCHRASHAAVQSMSPLAQ